MTRREDSASAGLTEVKGTYGDIRVGSKVQGDKATNDDVWEIIDLRNPEQYDYKTTPWFLARNVATGVEVSIPPKTSAYPCTFMVPTETVDPEEEKPKLDVAGQPPRAELSDQEAVDLLVEKLGARLIAWKDHETGIVKVPSDGPWKSQDFIDHLEVAHGMDLSHLERPDIVALTTMHGEVHSKNWMKARTGGGFPHQHDYAPSTKPFGDLH